MQLKDFINYPKTVDPEKSTGEGALAAETRITGLFGDPEQATEAVEQLKGRALPTIGLPSPCKTAQRRRTLSPKPKFTRQRRKRSPAFRNSRPGRCCFWSKPPISLRWHWKSSIAIEVSPAACAYLLNRREFGLASPKLLSNNCLRRYLSFN